MKPILQGQKFIRWPLEKRAILADADPVKCELLISTETQVHLHIGLQRLNLREQRRQLSTQLGK
eukprot:2910951-Pleurochrysis_carterae.AAC.2